MRTLAILVVLLLPASLVLFASTADATQVRYQSVEQLGSQSEAVVRGKVTDVRSFWNSTQTKIYTETTITVDESYKGSGDNVVRVLQLGGEVDGVQVTVHGALAWLPGEEVVLFLVPNRTGSYHVSGFCQGKFEIERDQSTGKAFVRWPSTDDVQLVDAPDGGAEHLSRSDRMPLERFLDKSLGLDRKGGSR